MSEIGQKPLYDIPKNLDLALWKTLDRFKHNLELFAGTSGDILNKAVTFRDLIGGLSGLNIVLSSTSAIYLGLPTEDGSYRMIRVGDNLVFERRESGVWNEKGKFRPS